MDIDLRILLLALTENTKHIKVIKSMVKVSYLSAYVQRSLVDEDMEVREEILRRLKDDYNLDYSNDPVYSID